MSKSTNPSVTLNDASVVFDTSPFMGGKEIAPKASHIRGGGTREPFKFFENYYSPRDGGVGI